LGETVASPIWVYLGLEVWGRCFLCYHCVMYSILFTLLVYVVCFTLFIILFPYMWCIFAYMCISWHLARQDFLENRVSENEAPQIWHFHHGPWLSKMLSNWPWQDSPSWNPLGTTFQVQQPLRSPAAPLATLERCLAQHWDWMELSTAVLIKWTRV
jgi:hypothetical protein